MIPASRRRLAGLYVVMAVLLAVLGSRLWALQVSDHAHYVALATQDRIRDVVQPSVRGEIVADNGQPLVDERSTLEI